MKLSINNIDKSKLEEILYKSTQKSGMKYATYEGFKGSKLQYSKTADEILSYLTSISETDIVEKDKTVIENVETKPKKKVKTEYDTTAYVEDTNNVVLN